MRQSISLLLSVMCFCGTVYGLDYSIDSPTAEIYRMAAWGSGNKEENVTVTYTAYKLGTTVPLASDSYADPHEGWYISLYFNQVLPHGTPVRLELKGDGQVQAEKVVTAVNYPQG